MGVFDSVKCDYPLPWPEAAEFGYEWQTKDTDCPYQDEYELRADGTLWHKQYDSRMETSDKAPLGFWMHRENERWEQVKLQGEFEIHHYVPHKDRPGHFWYSVRFWFKDSVVADLIANKADSTPTPEAK